ncbi:hypothetical protein ACFT7S_25720 [Streptomyces sp. NPDC057136]|uniref:hypothetical protein n=1 Tax=Streptomyces sp. NPDC057136 TaxID=3346029 RepID=UPI00362D26E8
MRNESQRQPKAPETPELAALLAAARRTAAPDADDELRATAAFRAARDGGAHDAVRSPWWRRRDDWRPVRRWRGMRPVRVMLGGFVVAATLGGVAVAAGTGTLPTPFGDGGKGAPDSVHPTRDTSATPEGHRSGEGGAPRESPTPGGDGTGKAATTTPGFLLPSDGPGRGRDEAALCRVYAKHRDSGKAVDSTAFARLKAAAGEASEAAVNAYCDVVLGRPAPGSKGAPDGSGKAEKDGPVPPRGTGGGVSAGAVGGGPSGAEIGGRNGAAAG